MNSQSIIINLENSKSSTAVKLSSPWGWPNTASAIQRLSEELQVESVCNFRRNAKLCCSVMWVTTANQSWHFPQSLPFISLQAKQIATERQQQRSPNNLHSAEKRIGRAKLTIATLYLHISTNDNLPKTRRHSTLLNRKTEICLKTCC